MICILFSIRHKCCCIVQTTMCQYRYWW